MFSELPTSIQDTILHITSNKTIYEADTTIMYKTNFEIDKVIDVKHRYVSRLVRLWWMHPAVEYIDTVSEFKFYRGAREEMPIFLDEEYMYYPIESYNFDYSDTTKIFVREPITELKRYRSKLKAIAKHYIDHYDM